MLRGRTVYDIITLFSEVSGLADIFFVVTSFMLNTFYTPLLLEAALHKHMGPIILPKLKKLKPPKTDSQGIYEILTTVSDRFSLKLNIWLVILSKVVPARFRSRRTNRLFKLVDKS
jgi:hypothetical protein